MLHILQQGSARTKLSSQCSGGNLIIYSCFHTCTLHLFSLLAQKSIVKSNFVGNKANRENSEVFKVNAETTETLLRLLENLYRLEYLFGLDL